ncbi:hypothetical protein ACJIZ3_009092 [Penstemon smallii]|uniref:Uncharacterized protein n=1 Tax=Penstemon smallii TaxID=265156 RepID=A0ABD3TCM3_9LAMI
MHENAPNRNIYCEKCSNELGFQNNAIDTEGQHYIFVNKCLLQRQR